MPNKTVFVLLDGLQSQYAREHLGYLEHCVEKQKAAKYEVLGELPSASRPMYETIFTGVSALEHGITNNGIVRLSNQKHLFQMLKKMPTLVSIEAFFTTRTHSRILTYTRWLRSL